MCLLYVCYVVLSLTEAIEAIEEILSNDVDTRLIEDLLSDLNLLGDLAQTIQSGQAVGLYSKVLI